MIDEIMLDAEERMQKSMESLTNALKRVRTGRANASLLDSVTVDYYGTPTQISQVANVSVEEGRCLVISPWEKPMVPAIEKALLASDIGITPNTSGEVIRLNMPALTEETRKDFVKKAKAEAEAAKVAVRNIRRDANGSLKALLKDKEITEDEERGAEDDVQKLTDKYVAQSDAMFADKEKELMAV